jgi:hypothetical protein
MRHWGGVRVYIRHRADHFSALLLVVVDYLVDDVIDQLPVEQFLFKLFGTDFENN